jgi:hypothetical protein
MSALCVTPRTVPFLRANEQNNDRERLRDRPAIFGGEAYAPSRVRG